ncbi:FadR/GntR family transcriptional regulator [Oceaniglobus roseus]|uniref:FadR/GntR family transcriptional regulator n=1 Tax=Oceaniglobus roseus TaxID=1737570 RepID=UPI000C7EC873|nr:FCD domain-containing protein [Kandeliimicrobium roseum]
MRTAEDALDLLQKALMDGAFAPGDRLPPERDLAAQLGVGRSTLRKALDRLEREGRLRREVGRGTFVSRRDIVAMLHLDTAPGPADVLELREMIEPQIAGLAALRASDAAVDALRLRADAAESAQDWSAWEAEDSALHTAIAEAARNPLLAAVLDTLNGIRNQQAWRDLRSATLDPERQRLFSAQHRAVIDAIASRSAPKARDAMRSHLNAVRRAMTQSPEEGHDHD